MGEEEKKPERKKAKEAEPEKKEEAKAEKPVEDKKDEKKSGESKEPPPPPPEIVLRVYMHCEGCARKVRRCLKGFQGVEDVETDCKSHKVVVKGEKADPLKVLERVQRKSHRQVELLSPIPKPPPAEEAKKTEEKEAAKPEEKKPEPQVVTVVLNVHMHCEACAQEIKRRILRMKGVESVEPDLKSSQVSVKGVFDPPNLVDYVYKKTGKHALIVKQEPEQKEEEKGKEGKQKAEDGGDKDPKKYGNGEAAAKDKKDGGGNSSAPAEQAAAAAAAAAAPQGEEAAAATVGQLKNNEFYYYYNYPQNSQIYPYAPRFDIYANAYPPQICSDENPNACSVM